MLDLKKIREEVKKGGTLEYKFNLDDVDSIEEREMEYYAGEDLLYIASQHACVKSCQHHFKKKTAIRNKDKMLEVLRGNRRRVEKDIKYSVDEIQRLTEKITKVESDNLEI